MEERRKRLSPCIHRIGARVCAEALGFELLCGCILSCVCCTAEVISSESIGDVALYVKDI
jgi:hypothetical protein